MYYDYGAGDVGSVLSLVWTVWRSLGTVLSIATYVLMALGLYTIAKRRGIRHAWLSWIPVGHYWILGCISDQYRYVAKGENKSKRKLLLVLSIVQMILSIVAVVMVIKSVITIVEASYGMNWEVIIAQVLKVILLVGLPMAALGIAILVICYMALYDLYASCNPQNKTLYLVLSIIFNVTMPFFVFFNRNKELGMPPRRETTWEQNWQEG